jgi:hypothetical protein
VRAQTALLEGNVSDPFKPPLSPDVTLLDEIAMAINERGFRREPSECSWPYLKPEMKALANMIRQRAEKGDTSPEIMIGFAALLVIEGMVAQNLCDLRLATQALPPFGKP